MWDENTSMVWFKFVSFIRDSLHYTSRLLASSPESRVETSYLCQIVMFRLSLFDVKYCPSLKEFACCTVFFLFIAKFSTALSVHKYNDHKIWISYFLHWLVTTTNAMPMATAIVTPSTTPLLCTLITLQLVPLLLLTNNNIDVGKPKSETP